MGPTEQENFELATPPGPSKCTSILQRGEEKESKTSVDTCAICLNHTLPENCGRLNCCSHLFCFTCIMDWAKVENTCPICKRRFHTVSRPMADSFKIQQFHLPTRHQRCVNDENSVWAGHPLAACSECSGSDDEHLLLLCDGCDSVATHTYCAGLGREVPEGDWMCATCQATAGENGGGTAGGGRGGMEEEEEEDVSDYCTSESEEEAALVGMEEDEEEEEVGARWGRAGRTGRRRGRDGESERSAVGVRRRVRKRGRRRIGGGSSGRGRRRMEVRRSWIESLLREHLGTRREGVRQSRNRRMEEAGASMGEGITRNFLPSAVSPLSAQSQVDNGTKQEGSVLPSLTPEPNDWTVAEQVRQMLTRGSAGSSQFRTATQAVTLRPAGSATSISTVSSSSSSSATALSGMSEATERRKNVVHRLDWGISRSHLPREAVAEGGSLARALLHKQVRAGTEEENGMELEVECGGSSRVEDMAEKCGHASGLLGTIVGSGNLEAGTDGLSSVTNLEARCESKQRAEGQEQVKQKDMAVALVKERLMPMYRAGKLGRGCFKFVCKSVSHILLDSWHSTVAAGQVCSNCNDKLTSMAGGWCNRCVDVTVHKYLKSRPHDKAQLIISG